MIQELTTLYQKQEQTKKLLFNLKDEYLSVIYGGLVNGRSVGEIHTELFKATINYKTKNAFFNTDILESATLQLIRTEKQLLRKVESSNMPIADLVYLVLKNIKADRQIAKSINESLVEQESKAKENIISEMVAKNRNAETPIVFYLCSGHNDCALDHKPYQKRIYYDDRYRSVILDKYTQDKISDYIIKHNLKSMQEIMHRPVWLITRPHCRHYFIPIPTERVFKMGVNELLRRYKANRRVGNRKYLQTLKTSPERRLIGEIRNAELVIERYRERLHTHETLYKTFKSSLVRSAILKDKQLINKWNEYLEKLRG